MLDPVSLEILKHAFLSAAEEESAVLRRTAHSRNVRERTDYSTAICDAQGRLVAQAMRSPQHLGGVSPCVKAILAEYGEDICPEDVFLSNDPYSGGQHLPDVQVSYPIFSATRLVGFGCTLAHHEDIGGRLPGSQSVSSQELYEEGLRLHHVRLYQKGQLADGVSRIISANVRYPENTLGDLRAQLAAAKTGAARITELMEKYGQDIVLQGMTDLMDISERRVRASLAAIPAGEYTREDYLDSDGITGEPCTVRATVRIQNGTMAVDFSGTSPQAKGSVNSSLTSTYAAVFFSARALCDPDIMQNEGSIRPITLCAPEGTLVNPRFPAACSARASVSHRIADCILGALAEVVPDRVDAACYGTAPIYTASGPAADGRRWLLFDGNHGSGGARLKYDGNDGCTARISNPQNLPIEACESRLPIRFVRYGFMKDSGGPGRRRGGLAVERSWQLLSPGGARVEMRGDRQRFPPYGLAGGKPGRATRVSIVRRSGAREEMPASCSAELMAGDIFSSALAAGGGFGEPWEREPELVLRDLLDGKISIDGARDDYGVVVRGEQVDLEATRSLRSSRPRGAATPPDR